MIYGIVHIPDDDKPLDTELLARLVYEAKRTMEDRIPGETVKTVDVVIARAALPKVWKKLRNSFEKKFGVLYNLPEFPPGAIHHWNVLEDFVSVARIFLPWVNCGINLMIHPYFDRACPNMMAILDWGKL